MSDEHMGILLEDIQDKLQGLAEAVGMVQEDISVMKPQIAATAADVKEMKAMLRIHDKELQDHAGRLQTLEMPSRA